jgi:hypothetical protein
MSLLPGYEHDVFISYAHIDNQPLTEGQRGWIDHFHAALERRLSGLLGAEPAFFRDPELKGNDYYEQTLPGKLQKTAILVSVLSPRYAKSEWCQTELDAFCRAAEATGGVRVGNRSRIFKVIKLPVPREQHPLPLQGLLGYDFFERDPRTGAPREFGLEFGEQAKLNFVERVNDLAYEIMQLLQEIGVDPRGMAAEAARPTGLAVYLAATTSDLRAPWDAVRRDLLQRGHQVLPDRELPLYGPELVPFVRGQLGQARLSIHLLGAHYGTVPEAEEQGRSLGHLQHDLATEVSRLTGLRRILWLPAGLAPAEARQKEFVAHVLEDPEAARDAEVLQGSIEELKTLVHEALARAAGPGSDGGAEELDGPPRVYLLCDARDREAVQPVEDRLFEAGCEVMLPAEEGDPALVREDHREKLRVCDAALIYAGLAPDSWVSIQLGELRKAPGYGRTRPLTTRAILLGPPDRPWKHRFRTREAPVLRYGGPFEPAHLTPFLAGVATGRGGARGV